MADEPDHLTETDLTKLAAELTTIREELEDRLFERIYATNRQMNRVAVASRIAAAFIKDDSGIDVPHDVAARAAYWARVIEEAIDDEFGTEESES